jgi:tetratricopeptide (TPR) repeat protein
LADEGQRAIARYGAADYLPGDPLRVDEQDFAAAAEAFSKALRLTPDTQENAFFRRSLEARRLFCAGRADPRSDAGRQALEQCLRMPEGPQPEAWNALGIYHLETARDYAQAVESFGRARELAPHWAYPRHNLALALAEQGDYAAAEREYRDAIAAERELPYLHYNLGLLYQRTSRSREAKRSYEAALRAYNAAVAVLEQRAAEWESVYPSDASVARARAAVFKRNKAEVYNAMGTLAQARGDDNEALRQYGLALDANPELWIARYNRALVLARDDPGQARRELELVLKADPANRAAQRALERLNGQQ